MLEVPAPVTRYWRQGASSFIIMAQWRANPRVFSWGIAHFDVATYVYVRQIAAGGIVIGGAVAFAGIAFYALYRAKTKKQKKLHHMARSREELETFTGAG